MMLGGIGAFLLTLFLIGGGVTIVALFLIFSYAARSKGLTKGMSQREVEEMRKDIAAIREEIATIREQQADLILMVSDSPTRAIPEPPRPPRKRPDV